MNFVQLSSFNFQHPLQLYINILILYGIIFKAGNMAAAGDGMVPNEICQLCQETAVNKSYPPCWHVFCYKCIRNHVEENTPDDVNCPACGIPMDHFIHSGEKIFTVEKGEPRRKVTRKPGTRNKPKQQ